MTSRAAAAAAAALAVSAACAEIRVQRTPEDVDRGRFLSDAFAVELAGNPADVRRCRVSGMDSAYLEVEADEPVSIKVRPKGGCSSAVVRPLSRNVAAEVAQDGSVSLSLPDVGNYVLELDGGRTLHMFVDPVEDFEEDRIAAAYCFGPGVHNAGYIYPRENECIYVDRDAVVYGSVQIRGASSVRIVGHGVIDATRLLPWLGDGEDPRQPRAVSAYESHNPNVTGPLLMGSNHAVAAFFACNEVSVSGAKLLAAERGVRALDIVGCSNGGVADSFLRSAERGLSLRGTLSLRNRQTSSMQMSGVTVWSDGGRAVAIGPETWAGVGQLVFDGFDLVCMKASAIDIDIGGPAGVWNTSANDIRVEYPLPAEGANSHLVRATNWDRFVRPGWEWNWDNGWTIGRLEDFSVRGMKVTAPEGAKLPDIVITAWTNSPAFGPITLRDFTLNGARVNPLETFGAVTNENAVKRMRVR